MNKETKTRRQALSKIIRLCLMNPDMIDAFSDEDIDELILEIIHTVYRFVCDRTR